MKSKTMKENYLCSLSHVNQSSNLTPDFPNLFATLPEISQTLKSGSLEYARIYQMNLEKLVGALGFYVSYPLRLPLMLLVTSFHP